MSNENLIYQEQSLIKFSESAAAMAKMKEKATGLVIKDVKDYKGLQVVRATRLEIKRTRVGLVAYADEVKRDALSFLKKVNIRLNPLVEEMKAMEAPLWGEEQRIAKEKQANKEAIIQKRIDELGKYKAAFDYKTVAKMSKVAFRQFLKKVKADFELAEFNRLADEARLKELESQQKKEPSAVTPTFFEGPELPLGFTKDEFPGIVMSSHSGGELVANFVDLNEHEDFFPLKTLLGQIENIVIMPFATEEAGAIGTEVVTYIEKWKSDINKLLTPTS